MILFKVFHVILTMSFLGTMTALVILFVKKIFKQKISAFWHYLIWLILLIRLIIPYAPESNLSIFNFFTHNQQKIEEIQSPRIRYMSSNSIYSNNTKTKINTRPQENIVINPSPKSVWFTFNKIRQDAETACDTRVLSCIEPEEYKKYGNTMLKMLDIFAGYNCPYGVAGLLNHKKHIMERVQNIVNFKKHYFIWSLIGIVLFSGLAISLLTNAKEQPKEVIKITYEAEAFAQNTEFGIISRIKPLSNKKLLS
ncbi:hypothetical protein GM661_08820 [Iocasia frigidifontis]|uniref:Peptidase M56 domain-containing protein n=1 Tax=Iocasia fonsfrigidae TaxID=2682810 RepID=A0A8A7KF18_9FIRM|nr:M56 family metallopeptidase [Iocasia fonsfrigidae]QTL98069.1 hypothetical protein GM661_08820 [Iocasia fonsfrigidae]